MDGRENPLTDRKVAEALSLSLSLYICILYFKLQYIYIYVYLSLSLPLPFPPLPPSLFPSLSLFVPLCPPFYVHLIPLALAMYPLTYLSIYASICLSTYLCIYRFVCQSIFLSIHLSLFLFPHNFVWGSCFWFSIPGRFPASSSRLLLHAHTHTQLCHIPSLTYNTHTHTTSSHTISHIQKLHTHKVNIQ